MSDVDASLTHQAEDEPRALPDASFKVDSSSLGDDETDFAKAMGFAGDAPTPKPARASRSAAEEPAADLPADRSAEADEEESQDAGAGSDPEPGDQPAATVPQASDRDWEDIHPRTAADGDQATLQARAD